MSLRSSRVASSNTTGVAKTKSSVSMIDFNVSSAISSLSSMSSEDKESIYVIKVRVSLEMVKNNPTSKVFQWKEPMPSQ